MKPVGFKQGGLGGEKFSAAQMVDEAFNHAFVGDNQYILSGPVVESVLQCPLASCQNALSIFTPRWAKVPAGAYLFVQQLPCLCLNLWDGFAFPLPPILFPEPGISFKWNF